MQAREEGGEVKRYNPGCIRSEAEMFEEPNGEWVKYEDVKKLEELSRELVEIIRAECADCEGE